MTSRPEIAARLAAATPGPNGTGILLRLDEVRALIREIAELEAKVADLEGKVYVPGVWRCPKCDLNLVSTELHAGSGAMRANNAPQDCPNGCGPLWRKSEREAGNELVDRLDGLTDRATAAEAKVAGLREALEFYADPKVYEAHPHGPAFDRRDLSPIARAALTGTSDTGEAG